MRVLNCDMQPNQPFPQEEDDYRREEEELVKFDVDYLMKCLSMDRNTSYRIKCRPDFENRQSPQPDYLIEETATGDLITIEHARFFESEKAREETANLVRESAAGIVIQPINFPEPAELGKRLSEFVSEKLSKGQFKDFGHTERMLLARNRYSGVHIHRFLDAEPYFRLPEPAGCDHFYIIVERRLLEIL